MGDPRAAVVELYHVAEANLMKVRMVSAVQVIINPGDSNWDASVVA